MLGYDISWSSFNIIEVMSSNKFTYKVRVDLYDSNGDAKSTKPSPTFGIPYIYYI
jgi:hypothetical protein